MLDYLSRLWETSSLSPHGICLLWRPELIWTHVTADAVIGLSYYSIPLALAYFVSHRNDIQYGWVFWAFAAFILACGTTHFFSIWTLWVPSYGTEAMVKVVTAAVSLATAIAIWPLLPQALAIPSTVELRRMNERLAREVTERNVAVAALQAEKTERLKTEDMLRQSQKMEAIGQLTGSIAHDFNNLLTIVVGNLERLDLQFRDNPDIHRAIRGAMEGAARGASLTHKLLAFGRRQPLASQRLNANTLIENMHDLLQRAVGERIKVTLDLAGDLWPVDIDPNQLENALLNLAVNARDAMPDGGTLTITSRNCSGPHVAGAPPLEGDHVLIVVRDTGPGMSEEVRKHAFEPFYTTKSVGEGTGLGLSQVYGFANQSNGHSDIESAPGAGTSVNIYLPRAQTSSSQAA